MSANFHFFNENTSLCFLFVWFSDIHLSSLNLLALLAQRTAIFIFKILQFLLQFCHQWLTESIIMRVSHFPACTDWSGNGCIDKAVTLWVILWEFANSTHCSLSPGTIFLEGTRLKPLCRRSGDEDQENPHSIAVTSSGPGGLLSCPVRVVIKSTERTEIRMFLIYWSSF